MLEVFSIPIVYLCPKCNFEIVVPESMFVPGVSFRLIEALKVPTPGGETAVLGRFTADENLKSSLSFLGVVLSEKVRLKDTPNVF
jgi:hypothetical protein